LKFKKDLEDPTAQDMKILDGPAIKISMIILFILAQFNQEN
jgi:hypothetical protein